MFKKVVKDYCIAYNKEKQIYFLDSISKDHLKTCNMITKYCEFFKNSVYKKVINANEVFIKQISFEEITQIISKIPSYNLETTINNNNVEIYEQYYTTPPLNCLQIKDKNYETVFWNSLEIKIKNKKE